MDFEPLGKYVHRNFILLGSDVSSSLWHVATNKNIVSHYKHYKHYEHDLFGVGSLLLYPFSKVLSSSNPTSETLG